MSRDSSKRYHRKSKVPDVVGMNTVDAMKKAMPGKRNIIMRLGAGRSEEDGVVSINTTTIRYRRFSVAWGVPMDELGYSYWFMKLFQQQLNPWDDLIFCANTYLPQARSFIHEQFLINTSSKYLVMLDSDVVPPPMAVEKLISYKLPLVGGWYRKKSEKPSERYPVVYDFDKWDKDGIAKFRIRQKPGEGIEEVDGAGAGFWVMRRDVAKAIGTRPYDMLRCGEDLEMCLKVREAGFKIYIDWSLRAEHRGVLSIV